MELCNPCYFDQKIRKQPNLRQDRTRETQCAFIFRLRPRCPEKLVREFMNFNFDRKMNQSATALLSINQVAGSGVSIGVTFTLMGRSNSGSEV